MEQTSGRTERRTDLAIPKCLLTIRYDTRCYFNVRSKADISQLNLPHGGGHNNRAHKLLSLTDKVLKTTLPSCLHNLITVQLPRSTRSSSMATLARPSTSSSLRITDRSYQYASPRLWNQLPASLCQPRTIICLHIIALSISSLHFSLTYFYEWHFFHRFDRLTTLIIHHPSLFHSRLKTFLFCKSFPP